jgi:hypothetical protein
MPEQSAHIEELIQKLEASADAGSLATARELVESVMELYGAGLKRITEILARKGEAGRQILEDLGRDELVGNLLAGMGLHPQDLESRVRGAIEKVNARLGARGTVEWVSLEAGILRLRLKSSAGSPKARVEEAMYEAAPDLAQVVIEEQGAASGFVPLESLTAGANGRGAHT